MSVATIYKFAGMINKVPNQIYGMRRNGQIPEELFVTNAMDGKEYIDVEKGLAWWEERSKAPRSQANAVVHIEQKIDPVQMLEMLSAWLGKTKSYKKLGTELAVVMEELKAAKAESEENQ